MTGRRVDLLQGTLDLLVLKTLSLESLHGWGISKRIQHLSREVLQVNQGSLYPALYRLEDQGLVRSRRGVSDEGRPVKIYSLTPAGRRRLQEEEVSWDRVSTAVNHVLRTT